jgi:hypothetical protein
VLLWRSREAIVKGEKTPLSRAIAFLSEGYGAHEFWWELVRPLPFSQSTCLSLDGPDSPRRHHLASPFLPVSWPWLLTHWRPRPVSSHYTHIPLVLPQVEMNRKLALSMRQGFKPWLSDATRAESIDRCPNPCATAGWILLIRDDAVQARVIVALLLSVALLALHLFIKPLARCVVSRVPVVDD